MPQRMSAARWQWWFPASRAGTEAFRTLRSVRPTGTAPGDRWEPVRLLDPTDLHTSADNDGDAAAVPNCAALLGVPHWLRDRHPATDFECCSAAPASPSRRDCGTWTRSPSAAPTPTPSAKGHPGGPGRCGNPEGAVGGGENRSSAEGSVAAGGHVSTLIPDQPHLGPLPPGSTAVRASILTRA